MTDFDSYKEQASLQKKQRLFYVAAAAIFVVGIAVFFARPIFSQSGFTKDKGPQLIPAEWLSRYFGTTDPDALTIGGYFGDTDQDGLNNYQEFIYTTSPISADTDLDGYPDGNEVAYGLNPNQSLTEVSSLQAEQELSQAGVEIPREEIKQYVEDNLESKRAPYVRQWNKNQLQLSNDFSDDAVDEYAKSTNVALTHLTSLTSDELLVTHFEGATVLQIDNFIRQQQNSIDRLLQTNVPNEFSDYHLALLNINEGFLGMAVAAKEWNAESGIPISGWLFPEIQHIAGLEQVYNELRISLGEKFGIPL